jgi:LuxR family maltose regulon positive regulatory protein
MVAGRRDYQRADAEAAVVRLRHAVELVALHPRPTLLVLALVYLADAELSSGDRGAAQLSLTRGREIAEEEPVGAFVLPMLDAAEGRVGRRAARAAKRSGAMIEELTDRELSILRILQGTASQREIAAALFLSINTVKAYTKSLYRKLEVNSRRDAVATARELELI